MPYCAQGLYFKRWHLAKCNVPQRTGRGYTLATDAPAAERGMIMDEVKYYPARMDYPNLCKPYSNADRIRSMSDEELAEFLTDINPTNCQDCGFSHGWRCQPDRDDYSDFEKCEEGRKRWLQQPAEED